MSSSDVAISVRGLGKAYKIRQDAPNHTTLGEAIIGRLRRPFRRSAVENFWALRNVCFDIKKGEVVGIIGRNGAGKSTLLKVLSRITAPTSGAVDLYGRVGSLLEVGTGFHQDLTGRENIYLNGAILGMSRGEIRKQFDAIVDFSGVEQFLDTPVKRYSSGMYVRLAFAVAAHLRSEIVVIDEVLAVGDMEFQRKCLGKMKEVSTGGRTVLFVSHNMHSISLLCGRSLVFNRGELAFCGQVSAAISVYGGLTSSDPVRQGPSPNRRGSGEYRFMRVESEKSVYAPDEAKVVHFEIRHERSRLARFFPSALLLDERGFEVAQLDGRLTGCWLADAPICQGTLVIRGPWLKPGRYRLDLYLCTGSGIVDVYEKADTFEVNSVLPYPCAAGQTATAAGLVFADYVWRAGAIPDGVDIKRPLESASVGMIMGTGR